MMHVADTRSLRTHPRAVAAVVALAAGSVLGLASPPLVAAQNPSIVGGNPATSIEEAPFQVALVRTPS